MRSAAADMPCHGFPDSTLSGGHRNAFASVALTVLGLHAAHLLPHISNLCLAAELTPIHRARGERLSEIADNVVGQEWAAAPRLRTCAVLACFLRRWPA
jgi:hypothetical protein